MTRVAYVVLCFALWFELIIGAVIWNDWSFAPPLSPQLDVVTNGTLTIGTGTAYRGTEYRGGFPVRYFTVSTTNAFICGNRWRCDSDDTILLSDDSPPPETQSE